MLNFFKKMDKSTLYKMYVKEQLSAHDIARRVHKGTSTINYWLKKHEISKRTIRDAIYIKHNPHGDPFVYAPPKTIEDALLEGIGIGLYWGEGTKRNPTSVRLGNSDPKLIRYFIKFLERRLHIQKNKLRFGLQIFSDTSPSAALAHWRRELSAPSSAFQKVIITPARGAGNYKHKSKYGVLTVHFNNRKLRDKLCAFIENLP